MNFERFKFKISKFQVTQIIFVSKKNVYEFIKTLDLIFV